jgi:hypothetical protein
VQDQIDEFRRHLVGRKVTADLDGAPELCVLDGVRGLNDAPHRAKKGMTLSQVVARPERKLEYVLGWPARSDCQKQTGGRRVFSRRKPRISKRRGAAGRWLWGDGCAPAPTA